MKKRILIMLVLIVCIGSLSLVEASSYWERMEFGFPNTVEVYDYFYSYQTPELEIVARIPQLHSSTDVEWETNFNNHLKDFLENNIEELKELAADYVSGGHPHHLFPFEGLIDYEVTLNKGGLLSIIVKVYNYTGGAHGMTFRHYYNYDLTTGERIEFRSLFPKEEDLQRVAGLINEVVTKTPEQYFIEEFTSDLFEEDQCFYLTEKEARVCFGLYSIAPYVSGIQEFSVSAP